MKKLSLLLFFALISFNSIAQQQWKFHIAYEDATGAKDTIWLIWDSTATIGVDTALGESTHLDHSKFNVYMDFGGGDTSKINALDYGYFPTQGAIVEAINYQYPLMISWDTAIFHASFLPIAAPSEYINAARIDNDYFFFTTPGTDQQFDMLSDNHTTAPFFNWGSQSQFPMTFLIGWYPLAVKNIEKENRGIKILPNPFNNVISITAKETIKKIQIVSVDNRIVYSENFAENENRNPVKLNLANLETGIYLIEITNNLNTKYYEKICKTN